MATRRGAKRGGWRAAGLMFGLMTGLMVGLMMVPAAAGCRIALVLAVDVSRSVSLVDYQLQQDGIVAALADPQVQAAFLRPKDHVALAIYEWGGNEYQDIIADWREIRSPFELEVIARLVAARQRVSDHQPTALGWAVDFGARLMETAPPCDKQVLDVSGDGRNNTGMTPATAYRDRDFGDLVVNGLAIGEHESDLAQYFQDELIRGPGAFVEVAASQKDFPAAIRRKLIRELSDQVAAQGFSRARGG